MGNQTHAGLRAVIGLLLFFGAMNALAQFNDTTSVREFVVLGSWERTEAITSAKREHKYRPQTKVDESWIFYNDNTVERRTSDGQAEYTWSFVDSNKIALSRKDDPKSEPTLLFISFNQRSNKWCLGSYQSRYRNQLLLSKKI